MILESFDPEFAATGQNGGLTSTQIQANAPSKFFNLKLAPILICPQAGQTLPPIGILPVFRSSCPLGQERDARFPSCAPLACLRAGALAGGRWLYAPILSEVRG